MNAVSWDSYKPTLMMILNELRPRNILEYGAGESTKTICEFDSVEHLTSVEHSEEYYNKFKSISNKLSMFLVPSEDNYKAFREDIEYDMAFIDGIARQDCIARCKDIPIVLLHDSEREQYQQEIMRYKYVMFSDNGSTAILTNFDDIHKRLVLCV